ncbi:MAG: P1 family peptidase [Lachnospiraceae bacterium]|nr:P1 family peptidase [Lachnospiraceae bacterium]
MQEIPITEIEHVKIGHAQDMEHATGCTVLLLGEEGARAGLDVRGGGPASRESELLKPVAAAEVIHAVLLSGGSAFGLDAAGGVMRYLEEQGIGFAVGDVRVPLVCQSDIYDLGLVTSKVRPDAAMAYEACRNAEKNCPAEGNVGAGTGATVGKLLGPDTAMNSGLGLYAVQLGELKMGAVVAVNALGDIRDPETDEILAGLLTPDHQDFADSEKTLYRLAAAAAAPEMSNTNTTIGAVITNGHFTKTQLCKIASMAHNGYARAIRPVHTMGDGDSIYALSVGDVVPADINVAGTLAAHVMAQAIRRAALMTPPMYGLLSAQSLRKIRSRD